MELDSLLGSLSNFGEQTAKSLNTEKSFTDITSTETARKQSIELKKEEEKEQPVDKKDKKEKKSKVSKAKPKKKETPKTKEEHTVEVFKKKSDSKKPKPKEDLNEPEEKRAKPKLKDKTQLTKEKKLTKSEKSETSKKDEKTKEKPKKTEKKKEEKEKVDDKKPKTKTEKIKTKEKKQSKKETKEKTSDSEKSEQDEEQPLKGKKSKQKEKKKNKTQEAEKSKKRVKKEDDKKQEKSKEEAITEIPHVAVDPNESEKQDEHMEEEETKQIEEDEEQQKEPLKHKKSSVIKVKVLVSGFNDDDDKPVNTDFVLIKQDILEVDCCVVKNAKRTEKVLESLVRGIPIVSEKYLEACEQNGKVEQFTGFLLDKSFVGMTAPATIRNELLTGMKIYVGGKTKIQNHTIERWVGMLGGYSVVRPKDADLIVVGGSSQMNFKKQEGTPVVSENWVYDTVEQMRKQEYEHYQVVVPKGKNKKKENTESEKKEDKGEEKSKE
ncbi:nucleosome-binding protein, putative [Entamoeba invadens IP1]|uniref:nucleosome-binding protein, putative n=1 Tax=Entamoeba invadens IP1 TaxID=370355 RepID=UPI0002C3EBDE|nr:nucleosome-binding protein, putative [Entamoeba invadens IP1]ELP94201.1 nucleosome-binding protein, putative [Entamoeba invadens IP1]|eukprot:XP_004260972.1 nucleosome-binding protein, putative [Entamoeba invadens IP1]